MKVTATKKREWLIAYTLILPAFLVYLIFRIYPVFYGFFLSLQDWDGFSAMRFIGFGNYREAFNDKIFLLSLGHNVIYAIFTVIGKNILGFILALFLTRKTIKLMPLWRTIFFIPVVVSTVAFGIIWSWLLNASFGLVNEMLRAIGLSVLARSWLSDPKVVLLTLIMVDIAKWTGYHTVIYIAGLQSLPSELFEAAYIDGARSFQVVRFITLPLLLPIIGINILTSLIGGFSVFDLVFILTGGGPLHASEVIMTRMYSVAFQFHRVGYGTAMTFIMFIVVFILSVIQLRLTQRRSYEF